MMRVCFTFINTSNEYHTEPMSPEEAYQFIHYASDSGSSVIIRSLKANSAQPTER